MARFTAVAAFVTVLVLAASAPAQAQTCDLTQVIAADPLLTNLSYVLSNVPDVNALFKAMPVNKTVFAATNGAFAKVMGGLQQFFLQQGNVAAAANVSLANLFTTPAQQRATLAVFLYHILDGGAYGPADSPLATAPLNLTTSLAGVNVTMANNTGNNATVISPIITGGPPSTVVAPDRYPISSTCNIRVHGVDTVLQAVANVASAVLLTTSCTPLTGAPLNINGSNIFGMVLNNAFTPIEVASLLTMPGTFFVPTDAAFTYLLAVLAPGTASDPAAALALLSNPMLRDALRGLVLYHVVPNAPPTPLSAALPPSTAAAQTALSRLPGFGSNTLAITKNATGVYVRAALNSAVVVQADQQYCLSQVVHTISAVLLPASAALLLPAQPAAASPPPAIVPTGAPKSGAAASAGSMVLLALAMILAMGAVLC